jgi:hypothetical protein
MSRHLTVARVKILASLFFVLPLVALADDDQGECNGAVFHAPFTALNLSTVSGTATLCIGREGVRGAIHAEGLTVGNDYTVWFFYNAVPPGRFDSDVADATKVAFRGRVRGLRVARGATITLLMFDHGKASLDSNVLALNLLTPTGGVPAAQAVFTLP